MAKPAFACVALLAAFVSACSTPPVLPDARLSPGEEIARAALVHVGAPYRFGGESPEGFDCSGLVAYVHERIGVAVPRSAAAQHRAARPVSTAALQPGDLVFFRIASRDIDHVGVYVGGERFVHAPRSSRPVSVQALDEPYYRQRFAGAGRFWSE